MGSQLFTHTCTDTHLSYFGPSCHAMQLGREADYENRQYYFSISTKLPRVMPTGQPSNPSTLLCSQTEVHMYACSHTVCVIFGSLKCTVLCTVYCNLCVLTCVNI